MVKTKKNQDFDLERMRAKYLPLGEENSENSKKVDTLFMKIFLNDFSLFTDILMDARNS
jgi:hypothetical protein